MTPRPTHPHTYTHAYTVHKYARTVQYILCDSCVRRVAVLHCCCYSHYHSTIIVTIIVAVAVIVVVVIDIENIVVTITVQIL